MILSNQVKCLKCHDTPYSTHRHDFKYCKCGAVAVDGGMSYLRRLGCMSGIKEMSIEMNEDVYNDLEKQLEWCQETGRNNKGIICAIMRKLRDHGYEVTKPPTTE